MTKLYYESHITIEPVFDERLEQFRDLSKLYNFHVATFLFKPHSDKPLKDFSSSRSTSYTAIVNRTVHCVEALQKAGFKVLRYKIEDTLVDSKMKDKFELLTT
jgi:hypothetical protein